uniref:Uncharacterized protein n=1 Tax=viral metagenome TaxID=1070528 RepID=A0A6M3KYM8_9ZZZZ
MKATIKIGEKSIKVRGLKWKERRELKADGYDIIKIFMSKKNDLQMMDDLVDRVVNIVFEDPSIIDDLEMSDVYQVFLKVIELSFVSEAEKKR